MDPEPQSPSDVPGEGELWEGNVYLGVGRLRARATRVEAPSGPAAEPRIHRETG